MSATGKMTIFLSDFFPRAGFLWKRRQSVPRILRSSERDALVLRALFTVQGGKKFRRREANVLIANAIDIAAKTINDENPGMRPEEGILEYLARAGTFSEFGQALPENIWVELVYQIAWARYEYERRKPKAWKDGFRNQLTELAHAIDRLMQAAGDCWDWAALEFFAYPHLMGGVGDYDSDDEEEEEEALAKKLEDLSVQDADGDIQMAD